MRNLIKILSLLLIGLMTLSACGFPFPNPDSETELPSPSSSQEDTNPDDVNQTPMLDLLGIYQQAISLDPENEGSQLVKILRYAAGELTGKEGFIGQEVRSSELTPIVMQAKYWISGPGVGTPEAEEIERLLFHLTLPAERLLPYAIPESKVSKPNGLASLSAGAFIKNSIQEPASCIELWDFGFPEPAAGETPVMCILYREFSAEGINFRIFYPIEWGDGGSNLEYIDSAEAALRQSTSSFLPFASAGMPNSDVVFTLLPHSNEAGVLRPNVLAAAWMMPSGNCGVGAYPSSFSVSIPEFQQTLAHEIFHCFQFRNFAWTNSVPLTATSWWLEGSAEFFGNVAYPDVNAEYAFLDDIYENIGTTSLFALDYENFLFFQYLANNVGESEVIRLLSSFNSSTSPGAYAVALNAGLPDFASFYHAFAKDYGDHTIADTGGGMIPTRNKTNRDYAMNRGDLVLTVEPFTLTFYGLRFPEGRDYTLTSTTAGTGKDDYRYIEKRGEWFPLPDGLNTFCGEKFLIMAATNVEQGSTYDVTIDVDYEEPEPGSRINCDPCLVGTWEMTPESVDGFMRMIVPPSVTYIGHTGRMITSFTADGVVEGAWEDLTVNALFDLGGITQDVTISYAGLSEGGWYTRDGIIYGVHSVSILTMTMSSPGFSSDPIVVGDGPGTSSAAEGPYSCSADTLSFTPPQEPLFTREFRRVTP